MREKKPLKKIILTAATVVFMAGLGWFFMDPEGRAMDRKKDPERIELPRPIAIQGDALAEVLAARRSVRQFSGEELTLAEISSLVWAGQGVTSARGFRTAPSAGALYPLETYLAAGDSDALPAGIYHYRPQPHQLRRIKSGDHRPALARAGWGQRAIAQAPLVVVITGVLERTTIKYGQRGKRYMHMEAGHAAQNILLAAVAAGLGGVPIGAFADEEISRILERSKKETPLYLIPVGHPAR